MLPRMYNVATRIFRRSWLALPFGVWVIVSVAYYWWLIAHISILETQNRVYQHKLKLSQSSNNMREMPVETTGFKEIEVPNSEGTVCETIHLTLVCMGKCGPHISPMLKSLLHHRQNPLHFHLVVDTKSDKVIRTLFKTWNLPDVKCSYYNAEHLLSKVMWIPNTHYSGVYLFVKLLYPDILPKKLQRVIFFDTDLTFLSDIVELWDMFRNMTDNQLIGLAENMSDWYLQQSRWPALGRGYNTGVMLLNLRNIRAAQWTTLWNHAIRENIKRLNKTALGDQDIINAIVKKYPHIVYNISCQYNVQMSTQTLARACYGRDKNKVKVVHWNSPSKHNIAVPDAEYFRSLHRAYVALDGNLLREKLNRCWQQNEQINTTGPNSDMCLSFRAASRVQLRTHIYYSAYIPHSDDNFDVTVVVQLSMDRLQFFERLVEHWEGPVSAAIYLADCEVHKLESFIKEQATLSARNNIAYHLVFKHDAMHYPVNYLRNVALEHVSTSYVFLMDADFVPMHALYDHLRSALQAVNPYPQKKCLVVAAFESQRYRASPPRNKLQLVARLGAPGGDKGRQRGDVAPFRAQEWPRGHRATNYSRWVTATAPYEVDWEADYEPYLVCHRSIPKYDTRFSGFGWNKVSHIVELRARGYRAVVLPDAFVVHTTHAPSADITAFRANPHYRICLALLKQEFLEDLGRKYNVTFEELKQEQVDSDKDKIIFNRAKDSS